MKESTQNSIDFLMDIIISVGARQKYLLRQSSHRCQLISIILLLPCKCHMVFMLRLKWYIERDS